MRVLVANIPLPENRFLVDLNTALSSRCELVHSSDAFWGMEGDFDVVHLHFPEYLTYEIERAYNTELTDSLVAAVDERLNFWASRSTIVVTRHVLLPHDALEDPAWEKMYECVYSYADGVVHFAQPSVDEFRERYGATIFFRGREPEHAIIPHHNYCSLPNDVSRDDARKALGIRRDANVMLVFGSIRSWEERDLVMDTFRGTGADSKVLLVSRWKERVPSLPLVRLGYWLRDITRLYHKLTPRYRFNYGFVEEADTQIYLKAADVLFIPRLKVLNSGNVTLGMTFGRVVVGPDSWDVGELLREMKNPVFDPSQRATAAAAVDKGFRLAHENQVGPANRARALAEWGVDRCAAMYLGVFTNVANRVKLTQ